VKNCKAHGGQRAKSKKRETTHENKNPHVASGLARVFAVSFALHATEAVLKRTIREARTQFVDPESVLPAHTWRAKNFSSTAQISATYAVATSQTMCKSTLA
jgi:hypothetical protein